MNILNKTFGFCFCLFLMLVLPFKADARNAPDFKSHCSQNLQFNDFATITSIPPELNAPLTQADNGGWVAIYEIDEDINSTGSTDEILIEISGGVNKESAFATVCINNSILAIVPTFQIETTDTNSFFKIQYKLELTSGLSASVKAGTPVYFLDKDTSDPITIINDWNDPDLDFQELAEVNTSLIPSIASNFDTIAGGYSYHEVYATYKPNDEAPKRASFTMEVFDRISTFNYAIFPPLETLSGCNASSLANLSVDDIKCFPMERQVEFKRYFLGLPEVIQRLFDFAADETDEPGVATSGARDFIVNYFNEFTPLNGEPGSGTWLTVGLDEDKYRYYPISDIAEEEDSVVRNSLESHYDFCNPNDVDFETCYEAKGCDIDNTLDEIAVIGESMEIGRNGCNANNLPADVNALKSHLGQDVNPDDPKILSLLAVNQKANAICADIGNGNISKIQAINASTVAISQYLADLDSRYEGFNACEKISAINTLSGIMDRTLTVLGQ